MKTVVKKISFVSITVIICTVISINLCKAQDMHFGVGGGVVMPLGEWGDEESTLLSSESWDVGYLISGELFMSDTSFQKTQFGIHIGFGKSSLTEYKATTLWDDSNNDDEFAPEWNLNGKLSIFEISPMLRYLFSDPNAEGLKIFGQLELGYVLIDRAYSGKNTLEVSPIDINALKRLSDDNTFHNLSIAVGPGFNFKKYIEILPQFHVLYSLDQSIMLMYPTVRVGIGL